MPRLSIEEDAWPRIDLIANRLKWNKREVIGTLALLWRDTQRLENEYVTIEDIGRITGIRSQVKLNSFVSLLAVDLKLFLTQVEVNLYIVNGTRLHIDRLNDLRQRGKLGGRPAHDKPIGFTNQNPIQYNTIQYSDNIYPPIIGESSNLEETGGGNDEKILSDLVNYAEKKLGVTATKPQNLKFKKEAANWDTELLRQNIDWIASHPKAHKESKSICRAFHVEDTRIAMAEWDKRLRIEIRRLLAGGSKPDEIPKLIMEHNRGYDPQKMIEYVQKITRQQVAKRSV